MQGGSKQLGRRGRVQCPPPTESRVPLRAIQPDSIQAGLQGHPAGGMTCERFLLPPPDVLLPASLLSFAWASSRLPRTGLSPFGPGPIEDARTSRRLQQRAFDPRAARGFALHARDRHARPFCPGGPSGGMRSPDSGAGCLRFSDSAKGASRRPRGPLQRRWSESSIWPFDAAVLRLAFFPGLSCCRECAFCACRLTGEARGDGHPWCRGCCSCCPCDECAAEGGACEDHLCCFCLFLCRDPKDTRVRCGWLSSR